VSKGWIGVDLDGTLAEYDEWQGPAHIGKPIPRMLERVKAWLEEGKDVRIVTARVSHDGSSDRMLLTLVAHEAITNWCVRWLGTTLPVTCGKDYAMLELWDDRAVQVIPNTGLRVDGIR
jgi:hypothetical protein